MNRQAILFGPVSGLPLVGLGFIGCARVNNRELADAQGEIGVGFAGDGGAENRVERKLQSHFRKRKNGISRLKKPGDRSPSTAQRRLMGRVSS